MTTTTAGNTKNSDEKNNQQKKNLKGAPNTEIDQLLNETDLGRFMAQNKVIIISLITLIIVGTFGYGLYYSNKSQSNDLASDKAYQFRENNFKKFEKKEIKANEIFKNFMIISSDIASFDGASTLFLEVGDLLYQEGLKDESRQIFEKGLSSFTNPKTAYFFRVRLASVYEDLNDNDKAMSTLENVLKSPGRYLEEKVYLDLGRLYLKKNNWEKAKASFEYVLEKGKEEEFKKMARIYLEEGQK
jgi:predicted negative regulator of RcsB-dependent stress response